MEEREYSVERFGKNSWSDLVGFTWIESDSVGFLTRLNVKSRKFALKRVKEGLTAKARLALIGPADAKVSADAKRLWQDRMADRFGFVFAKRGF
jgi:hypothetical protein